MTPRPPEAEYSASVDDGFRITKKRASRASIKGKSRASPGFFYEDFCGAVRPPRHQHRCLGAAPPAPQPACQPRGQWLKKEQGARSTRSLLNIGAALRWYHRIRSDTIKVFAPVGSRSSYRGCLLSTVQPVDKQGNHDASNGLRCGIPQELHHRHHLLSEVCPTGIVREYL